jgi:hypothetical protein
LVPRFGAVLWAALGLMVGVRLLLIFSLPITQFSDLAWYFERAQEWVATGQYAEKGVPTAFWPVGYPAFLAGVLALFGPGVLPAQLANVALSAATLIFMHVWCRRRFPDPRVADVAALLLAVYPNHMAYSVGTFSEPLFTSLLLAVLLVAEPGVQRWRLLSAGLLVGLATLVKAQTLLLGPLLLFVALLERWNWNCVRSALAGTVLACTAAACVISPWTYRNLVVMGSPILVSSNGGMSLLDGNSPAMTMSLLTDFSREAAVFSDVHFSPADQVAADGRAKAAAWGWIAANPGRFAMLMPKKIFRLWVPDGESEYIFQAGYADYESHRLAFRSVRVLNQVFYWLVLFSGFVGIARAFHAREPQTFILPLMIVFFTAISMVFSGQSRYHPPLMPFLMGYAASVWLAGRRFPRTWSRLTTQ